MEATGKKTRTKSSRRAAALGDARVTQDEIARRAYTLFLQRGAGEGRDLDDWLAAERQLMEERAKPRAH